MSSMKNYRAVKITDEQGNAVCVMMVHFSVNDEVIKTVLRRYQYEIVRRMIEAKINDTGSGVGSQGQGVCEIHIVHRLNLLKKLVRMTPELNRMVVEYRQMITGTVIDCKEYRKKNEKVLAREARKAVRGYGQENAQSEGGNGYGGYEKRVIETEEEKEFYEQYGHTYLEPVSREVVYFVDVPTKPESVKWLCLYSQKEQMVV